MKSTQRIGLLLTLVFLLPALFYSVYEFSSFDKDEKMIQEIYSKQLEAILFSVNQYSDDILGNWISRVESSLSEPVAEDSIPEKLNALLNLNSALQAVFFVDSIQAQSNIRFFSLENSIKDSLGNKTIVSLANQIGTIQQLVSYKKNGFQKIELLDTSSVSDAKLRGLFFIIQTDQQAFRIAGCYIDAELFIEDVVGPRIQAIARDQFILSALGRGRDSVIYTTVSEINAPQLAIEQEQIQAEALTTRFWIFPDYMLGIRTTGNTLQQLVRERTRDNILLLVGLDIILIIAVILVYRNLKKEVNLAQNKSDFISNVSHEIRTPLALISMFSETLEMNRVPTEEKKQEYYRIISKEAQRLTGIVNKILNFSQAEANKKVFHMERLHVNAEVKSILETYDFHLHNKGFEYSLADQSDCWVKADREALIESVINLIDNAMKYSNEKKRIEITTGKEGQFGVISVRDFGIGISKRDQKHIFDKFYRVPSGNLAKSKGTGLGLSLVKQLMEAQKGKITVSSELESGSTFKLYFPLE